MPSAGRRGTALRPVSPRRYGGRSRPAREGVRHRPGADGAEHSCRPLTIAVRYADHPAETRSRTLREPTADSPALTRAARAMRETLTSRLARVSGLALHAKGLTSTEPGSQRVGPLSQSPAAPEVFTDA
ncbi:DinB/UmuC family translesion DNA polymerase [Streptomyces sp. NBC_00576]|uniref:DinB/UmuC family translesion DNA polymerase n=1 Tax=Streptomyces sp. NBC_00576 TaxID=2903665 RepID=UPI002E8157B6|nr:hypothetical protein [Streptomyces sp. NBC_00576]WUB75529.1 hypothetical protein OG734_38795 [Streptomyces sp. NBC_00576]